MPRNRPARGRLPDDNPYRNVWDDEVAEDDQAVDWEALRDGMAIPKGWPPASAAGSLLTGGSGREKYQHLPHDHDPSFDETFRERYG